MMRTGRFEPFPLRRAIALARAGSFAATVTGTPSASSTFLMYSTAFVSLPGGSCVSMRTSAWKWRSSSALAAVQSTAAGVGVPRAGTCAAVAWRRITDAAATATAARIWLRFIAAILSWVAAQALQRDDVSPMLDEPRAVGAVRQVNAEPRRECRAHRLRVDRYVHVLEHAQPMPDDRCDVGGGGVADGGIGINRQRHDAVSQCSAGATPGCPLD